MEVFRFRVRASLFGYASEYPITAIDPFLSQTPHYSFGSLTRPLIQHSFARLIPFDIASGLSHSLLSVSFTFFINFLTARGTLCALKLIRFPWSIFASLLLALARIWLSIHSRYISYTAPLHIFSSANITCTTPHIISKPSMLPCASRPGHMP